MKKVESLELFRVEQDLKNKYISYVTALDSARHRFTRPLVGGSLGLSLGIVVAAFIGYMLPTVIFFTILAGATVYITEGCLNSKTLNDLEARKGYFLVKAIDDYNGRANKFNDYIDFYNNGLVDSSSQKIQEARNSLLFLRREILKQLLSSAEPSLLTKPSLLIEGARTAIDNVRQLGQDQNVRSLPEETEEYKEALKELDKEYPT